MMMPGDSEAHVEGHSSLPTVRTHEDTWVKEGDRIAVGSKQYEEARHGIKHTGNL